MELNNLFNNNSPKNMISRQPIGAGVEMQVIIFWGGHLEKHYEGCKN